MSERETEPRPDEQARRRARPYRLILAVQVADVVAGALIYVFADVFAVPGRVFGLPVMEFVGLALIVIGVMGYILFKALERQALGR